jgi:alpha-mannosidase
MISSAAFAGMNLQMRASARVPACHRKRQFLFCLLSGLKLGLTTPVNSNRMKRVPLFLLAILGALQPLHADDNDSNTFQKQPAKPVDFVHDKNLYVVGYAHLDTQWNWTYVETIQNDIRNTMEQNFLLLDKYPNYVFNFTGSRRYELMKEYYPEDYARVKKYVAEGRWIPAGSSVDENDTNIPSLESITRHFLYGNRFFSREFGKYSQDYLLPDCFGFPASLPTIMAHGGVKFFSTQKLTWGSAVGIPFNVGVWIGPDGSSVMAALNPGGYGNQIDEDLSKSPMWLKRIDQDGEKSGVYADYKYFGIGDQGGSPKASTVAWVERALVSGGPVRVIEGSSDQISKDITPKLEAQLPTYKGELLLVNHSAGSISSEAYMKRWNRKNEQLAAAAEGAATTAAWLGAFPYPYDPIYQGWDLVLGSQMHDIMPGTSVPKAYEFSWNDEVLALNHFASVTEHASAAVVSELDTTAQGIPVAVYNPLGFEREDPVEADVAFPSGHTDAVTAYDPQGKPVPTQILGQDGGKTRVLFIAKAPSVGYAIYDLRPGAAPASSSPSPLTAGGNSLENARYRVTLNAAGDIASIFDKSLGREMLSAPMRLSFHTENPSHYPSWNMDWEDREKPARDYVGGSAKISILENGPARVALRVERTTENSTFTQEIRLAAGSAGNRVEILDHIDWRSFEASLKADFPFAAANPQASFEDKVGVVQRGNDNPKCFELPLQQWMDLTDASGSYGVSVLNDSKYGSDKPDDHTLRLTLIYTPGTRGGEAYQGTQDQGRHEILYALAPHRGDWITGRTAFQAARLNQPLRVFLPATHAGSLGKTFSLLSVNSDQIQVMAVKQAEDSHEIVVRVKELTGQPATGLLLRFAAPITAAREVDGQERPIGDATVTNGTLAFDVKGFGLRAFAVTLAPPVNSVPAVTSQAVSLAYDTDVVSSRAKRNDGAMDADGGTYPAEMFPAQVTSEGVEFHLGPVTDGAKNAVSAKGQQIDLPPGDFDRVHLLVAADGDATAQIKIGDVSKPFNVPNWTGFIGQWDNRVWDPVKDSGLHPADPPVGLAPGYIKRTPIAWFATHHNTPDGDAYYHYSYLFQLSYDLPPGTKSLTLPNDRKIRVFAISTSHEPSATPPGAPLYDTLADHQAGGAPVVLQAGQTFADATRIALLPPLFHEAYSLHYTLDGTDPTAASPVYHDPFFASDTVNIAAREIDAGGYTGPVARGVVTVHDTTPPRLLSALTDTAKALNLVFSEPLNPATASDAANYTIQPAVSVNKITPSADGVSVTINFAAPLERGTDYTVAVHGIKDASPAGNVILPVKQPFNAENIVYTLASASLPAQAVTTPVPGLPVLKRDPWTMNLLVKADTRPVERVILAGFGPPDDQGGSGAGARYFAIFPEDIEFWAGGKNLKTNSPLDLGRWQMLSATYNGDTLALYKDGEPIGKMRVGFGLDASPSVSVGASDPWDHQRTFAGSIKNFTIRRGALSDKEVKKLFEDTAPAQ